MKRRYEEIIQNMNDSLDGSTDLSQDELEVFIERKRRDKDFRRVNLILSNDNLIMKYQTLDIELKDNNDLQISQDGIVVGTIDINQTREARVTISAYGYIDLFIRLANGTHIALCYYPKLTNRGGEGQ